MTGRPPVPLSRASEGSIFQSVEMVALQMAQRSVSGAEIVEREAGAELAHARQQLRGVFRVLHHEALGHLKFEGAAQHMVTN